jgi:hypothetical protein
MCPQHWTAGPGGKWQSIFYNIWHTGECLYRCLFCTLVCPQPVCNEGKELFFTGPTLIFPGIDYRQTYFTLNTNRRCFQTGYLHNKVPKQHLMSQSHRNSEHWYSCRQRMVYVRWLAWISDIFQRFSSNWNLWSCSHDPTSGNIQRSVFVPFSDFYFLQNLWDWWVFVIYAISCTVQIITVKIQNSEVSNV